MVADITHVIIAFMPSSRFNQKEVSDWPLFTTVDEVRSKFAEGTKIMIAIGGWGDTVGFSKAATTVNTRRLFAKNVKAMVDATGADGRSMPNPCSNLLLTRTRCRYRLGVSLVWLISHQIL
jgi:GH18 family chitinase